MTTISGPISITPNFWNTPPTPFERFKKNPALFLAQFLYAHNQISSPSLREPLHQRVKIVCISDTHNTTPEVPDGDILLHAGDLTNDGTFAELQAQLDWINSLPHSHKIITAGNHDRLLDPAFIDQFPHRLPAKPSARDLNWHKITFLNDSGTTVEVRGRKITVFGSPMTPYCGSFGFQYDRMRDIWKSNVPLGIDILLTHGPPKGHMDMGGKGCQWLSKEIGRKKPRLVVFGHIHQGRGTEEIRWDHVERAYDGVCAGERGLLSVLGMAIVVAVQWVFAWIGWKKMGQTTFVNAAVVGDHGNKGSKAATVVEI